MPKFSGKFEDGLSVIAEKVDSNKYLGSIKDAFTAYVPFIIAGSFGTLLTSLVSSTSTGLAQWVPWLTNLGPAFSALSFCTISCMTLPIVYLIATQLARRNGTPGYATGVLCLAAYISMVPNAVTATVTDAASNILEASAAGLPSSALGAQGLFIGMILTVIVCELFSTLTKIERLKIHMPDSVPPAITSSFNTLIPIFLLLVLTSVCGALFELATGSYLNEWMYSVLQRPIEVLANTPVGVIFLALFSQLFWFLGIHGGLVIEPIRSPLSASALAANIAAVTAGGVAINPLTRGFWTVFVVAGGAGLTFSLICALLLFSKEGDKRAIAKMALFPGFLGISEPMVFGMPLVLNPVFAIPFILNSAIAAAISLGAINLGLISCSTVDAPFGLPLLLNATLSFGFNGAIVQLIILVVGFLIWIPFVLMSNRIAQREAAAKLEPSVE